MKKFTKEVKLEIYKMGVEWAENILYYLLSEIPEDLEDNELDEWFSDSFSEIDDNKRQYTEFSFIAGDLNRLGEFSEEGWHIFDKAIENTYNKAVENLLQIKEEV